MPRRRSFNPKRKIADFGVRDERDRQQMSEQCSYGGNPQHKTDPRDYQLDPPVNPRPGKTLCDGLTPIARVDATRLLRQGFVKGMVSEQLVQNRWPQNVWAIAEDGEVYEAQLENPLQGVYHGYPMPENDPLKKTVIEEWSRR